MFSCDVKIHIGNKYVLGGAVKIHIGRGQEFIALKGNGGG